FLIVSLLNFKVLAKINFKANQAYYQNLCAKKSSFNANKQVCTEYQNYLDSLTKNSKTNIDTYEKQLAETKNDISKMAQIINNINTSIKGKENSILINKKNIVQTKKEINNLEKELMDRLVMMQSFGNDNFTIDFLMTSNSIDDFLTKMDGVNAINAANEEIISDLNDQENKLVKAKKQLVNEEKQLRESQVLYKTSLKQYQNQEADYMARIAQERKAKALFNSQLNNLNIKDLEDELNNAPQPSKPSKPSKPTTPDKPNQEDNNKPEEPKPPVSGTLDIPVYHATVTATAWYYYGGGWHPGIDLANNTGTPVHAPGNGVVLYSGWDAYGYGNYVVAAFQLGSDTYTMIFGHMSQLAGSFSTISRGQVIGYMGSTGNSTGPHTHVEIFKHKNKSLSQVVNTYRNNYDIYFGLGYNSIGNCNSICRLAPQDYWGLSYYQRY
ncbi:MAG: peptidoglycan DD-metalloendopeptidase family protein, partial [Bacilli bacterium]|nr:peptidoglycan DD-metalloendopeptidase family protein [Bacilli bacterium]